MLGRSATATGTTVFVEGDVRPDGASGVDHPGSAQPAPAGGRG
jgi:hypothetical protein